MKRLLPAVLIAIFFHASLFALNPEWFVKKMARVQRPAITVTMSYKKKPAPPAPVKKPPQKIPKKKKVKVVKKVQKPAPAVKKEMPEPEPVKEQEIVEENIDTEEEVADPEPIEVENTGEYSGVVEASTSGTVSEAVPLYRMNPEPGYPKLARKRGYQGTVLLSVLVNKDGMVDELWLYKSCGYKILDNAALNTVKDWSFEPARRGDERIEMWVEVPVIFRLE